MGEILYLVIINIAKKETKVLSETTTSTSSPTSLETPTPVPTPTITPTPSPTAKPTPTPVPQPTFTSQQINEFVDKFAGQYSVSPHVLRAIAICESGFDPTAKKLSYAGLYQFGPNTWKNMRIKMGEDADIDLRFNAEEAVQTAAYVLQIGKTSIWPNCMP